MSKHDPLRDAACKGESISIFFPDRDHAQWYAKAKAICATCPTATKQACLNLGRRETHGVFGGLTPDERGAHHAAELDDNHPRCEQCSTPLSVRRRKYCSDTCKMAGRRKLERARRTPVPLACPHCGATFFRTTSQQRYCSQQHARDAYMRRPYGQVATG